MIPVAYIILSLAEDRHRVTNVEDWSAQSISNSIVKTSTSLSVGNKWPKFLPANARLSRSKRKWLGCRGTTLSNTKQQENKLVYISHWSLFVWRKLLPRLLARLNSSWSTSVSKPTLNLSGTWYSIIKPKGSSGLSTPTKRALMNGSKFYIIRHLVQQQHQEALGWVHQQNEH